MIVFSPGGIAESCECGSRNVGCPVQLGALPAPLAFVGDLSQQVEQHLPAPVTEVIDRLPEPLRDWWLPVATGALVVAGWMLSRPSKRKRRSSALRAARVRHRGELEGIIRRFS